MKPKEAIPHFKSREEEAEFWDTHDFTDFADEFKPVNVKFTFKRTKKTAGLTVRLEPEDELWLKQQATQKGIGVTTFVRMIIKEKRRQVDKEQHTQPHSNMR